MKSHSDAARANISVLASHFVDAFPVSTIAKVEMQVAAEFRVVWVAAFGVVRRMRSEWSMPRKPLATSPVVPHVGWALSWAQ